MATLLYHIQPWMKKSIVEAKDHIEKWVAKETGRQIQVVNKFLDAFELRLLARPTLSPNSLTSGQSWSTYELTSIPS